MLNPVSHETNQLQQLGRNHLLQPFSNFHHLHKQGARIIEKAQGCYLWDKDNNKFLDAMAGLWCVNIGYGRHELAEVAKQQLEKLPYYNLFFQTTNEPALALAEKLSTLAPQGMDRVFFTNSGSEANDTAMRMVRQYWYAKGKPSKQTIISRENAYHGSTIAGASLGGMKPMQAKVGLPIPGVEHIAQPYWYGYEGDLGEQEFGVWAAQELEKAILRLGEENVGAFLAEPVQGAGGVIIPPESYWPEIKKILAKYEILLVVDEVICGFGRTGDWFGSQYYDLTPDLMPIAKGLSSGYLPVAGLMVGERVAKVLLDENDEFNHGFTYSGHPVCCAVALENINIMQREGIVDQARDVTIPYLHQRWQELADHPIVGQARNLGMLGALELVTNKSTRARYGDKKGVAGLICRDHCFAKGLVMRACADSMVICPPLIITCEQIDELIEKARQALDLTAKEMGVM